MANVAKFLESINRRADLGHIVETAQDAFGPKTETERNRPLFIAYIVFGLAFSGLSVTVGMQAFTALPIPAIVALALGGLLLGAIEVFKNASAFRAYRAWKETRKPSGWAFAALVFSGLSVAGAYMGANEYAHEMRQGAEASAHAPLQARADSTYNALLSRAQGYRLEAEKFYNASTWKGKLSNRDKSTYAGMLKIAQEAEADAETARAQMLAQADSARQGAGAVAGDRGQMIVAVCLCVEFLIVGLSIARASYLFTAMQEASIASEGAPYMLSPNALHSIVELATLQGGQANYAGLQGALNALQSPLKAQAPPKQQIGFKALQSSPQGPQGGLQGPQGGMQGVQGISQKASNYLAKYPQLCADLVAKKGGHLQVTHTELASRHGVSIDTVYRVQTSILD
jgi:hypothetical protein